ncbi:MAG TPA: tyrosine-type recombinase/integrase, partial [Bryobacteraceae bacterium]|nr:tyrosine-type recombinase/integrase [Bryobacteraceae bacterium]
MPDLAAQIRRFIEELRRQNASAHTLRNYASDLEQFLTYFTIPDQPPPVIEKIDALAIREWLGHLYQQRLTAVSMRRKLAAVRSFFKFLMRDGVVPVNVARLVRTPKAPKTLPVVMTAEQTNTLVDSVPGAADRLERPYPARDLAIFELLYGCGLRVSELVGLNLDDFDFGERWVRVRGKGRKERQVPYASKASQALDLYIQARQPALAGERALFLNHRGRRLTDRGARAIVKFYARMISGDSSIHPHSLRHAYATHLLS